MKFRWNRIKSSTFKCDIQKWQNFITSPINNVEMSKIDKKRIIKQLDKNFTDWLKKKRCYNENMANKFLKCGYGKDYVIKVIEQLSMHYNIETVYER
jgi:hypothetical protein